MVEVKNGQAKCGICGHMFPLMADKHYISRDDGQVGVVAMFKSLPEDQLYDTFDCPNCGCQCVVQKRKRALCESVLLEETVETEEQVEGQMEIQTESEEPDCMGYHQNYIQKCFECAFKDKCKAIADGPACEGTGPDCSVPCPGVENCPKCKNPEQQEGQDA